MNFLRAFIASLLSLVCTLSVSAFVTLQTINNTILDKAEVKTWIAASSAYEQLLPTLLTGDSTVKQQLATIGNPALQQAAQQSLIETLPASFMRQSGEHIIDGAYDWIDSQTPAIQFEINATPYKSAFITNLSNRLEPQLAALPDCTSIAQFESTNPTCLLPGLTAAQAASSIATDVANQTPIFTRPITTQNFSSAASAETTQAIDPAQLQPNIPAAVNTMRQWLTWLPVIAVVSGILTVLLSRYKLKAARYLSGRLTIGLTLTALAGLLIATIGQSLSLNGTPGAIIGELVIRQAAPAIGSHLAVVSGSMAAGTFVVWITLLTIKKQRERQAVLAVAPEANAPSPQAVTTPQQPNQSQPSQSDDLFGPPPKT